jgi:hypothetical protein
MGGTEVEGTVALPWDTILHLFGFLVRSINREHDPKLKLKVINGIDTGQVFEIGGEETTIGNPKMS